MTSQHSKPGWGSIVGIYLLGPLSMAGPNSEGFQDTAMFSHHGEDYANTVWPVVVKAKTGVSAEQLATHLRDLADAVDSGFYLKIDPDRDTLDRIPHSLEDEPV